jgi:hypothetical protein
MGQAGSQVWWEIWNVLGPMLIDVMEKDKPVWHDDLLLMVNRTGAVEATYWSFCYSGIHDEHGKVIGVFTPVLETSSRVLTTRRM